MDRTVGRGERGAREAPAVVAALVAANGDARAAKSVAERA